MRRLMCARRQIAHAPDAAYPPDQFLPERFLDARSAAGDPGVWAFGYGRRCVPFVSSSSPAPPYCACAAAVRALTRPRCCAGCAPARPSATRPCSSSSRRSSRRWTSSRPRRPPCSRPSSSRSSSGASPTPPYMLMRRWADAGRAQLSEEVQGALGPAGRGKDAARGGGGGRTAVSPARILGGAVYSIACIGLQWATRNVAFGAGVGALSHGSWGRGCGLSEHRMQKDHTQGARDRDTYPTTCVFRQQ